MQQEVTEAPLLSSVVGAIDKGKPETPVTPFAPLKSNFGGLIRSEAAGVLGVEMLALAGAAGVLGVEPAGAAGSVP